MNCTCHITSACHTLDTAISDVYSKYGLMWLSEVIYVCKHCTPRSRVM
jgi:hypothetical protein